MVGIAIKIGFEMRQSGRSESARRLLILLFSFSQNQHFESHVTHKDFFLLQRFYCHAMEIIYDRRVCVSSKSHKDWYACDVVFSAHPPWKDENKSEIVSTVAITMKYHFFGINSFRVCVCVRVKHMLNGSLSWWYHQPFHFVDRYLPYFDSDKAKRGVASLRNSFYRISSVQLRFSFYKKNSNPYSERQSTFFSVMNKIPTPSSSPVITSHVTFSLLKSELYSIDLKQTSSPHCIVISIFREKKIAKKNRFDLRRVLSVERNSFINSKCIWPTKRFGDTFPKFIIIFMQICFLYNYYYTRNRIIRRRN